MLSRTATMSLAIAVMVGVSGAARCEDSAGSATGRKAGRSTGAVRKPPVSPSGSSAAPCARGTYRDDPICFGDGDKELLPTPTAGSAHTQSPASGEPSLKPTANVNSKPTGPGGGVYQSGVIYQPNGNAVTSNYGGGVKLDLPF